MAIMCPRCEEPIEPEGHVVVVSECYQNLDLNSGDYSDPEAGETMRILCPNCSEELTDDVLEDLNIEEISWPTRPTPIEPTPMFVLAETVTEGAHDWMTQKTDVIAVSDSPGPLIRMIYELSVEPKGDGVFETRHRGTFAITAVPVVVRKDGQESSS